MTKRCWMLVAVVPALAGVAWLALAHGQETTVAMQGAPSSAATMAGGQFIWTKVPPVNLSRSQYFSVTFGTQRPRIAVGPNRRLYVIWEGIYEYAATVGTTRSETLWTTRANPQSSWSEPGVISPSLTTVSEHADLATDADGRLHLAWHERWYEGSSLRCQLMYQSRSLTGTLTLKEMGLYDKLPSPAIAASELQNVHVAWVAFNPDSGYDVFHRRSPDGGALWLSPGQVITLPSTSGDVALGVDGNGRAHVAWKEELAGGIILYRVGTPGGDGMTWGDVITPSAQLTGCIKPSVALWGDDVFIGWGKQIVPQKFDIYFVRCSNLGCTTPITLGRSVVVNTADPSLSAPVLAVGDGIVAAVWHGDQNNDTPGPTTFEEVLFTYSTDRGQTWAEVTNISQTPGERSIDPDVVVENGTVHIVWRERYDSGTPQKYDVMYIYSTRAVYLPLVLRNAWGG